MNPSQNLPAVLVFLICHTILSTIMQTLLGAPPSASQKVVFDKNLSKSALKRLRRKQAQEEAASGSSNQVGIPAQEAESDEEPEISVAPPAAAPVSGEKAVIQPTPAVQIHSAPAATAVAPKVSPTVHVEAPAKLPASVNTAPVSNPGVIGKGAVKMDAPTTVEASHQPQPVHRAPSTVAASSSLPQQPNPSLQHQYQQQHLINLLLGGDSKGAVPNPSLYAATTYIGAPHSQYLAPLPDANLYAQHNQGLYGAYQHNTSTPPGHLYSHGHSQPAPAAPIRASNSVVAPPGMAAGRQPAGLNIQTNAGAIGNFTAPAFSPPPPGLSPPGSTVTSSRFTFGDFAAPAPASSSNTTLPSSYSYAPAPHESVPAPNMLYGAPLYMPTAPVAHNATAPQQTAAASPANANSGNTSGSSYYKSKSGFSVRL